MKQPSLLATRRSLVDRLADWGDQLRWQEFFDTYSKLIHSAARKSGLMDAEAQEVVQETVITVAKSIDKLKYDPAIGSFKGWLLQITRWRIADQFRVRIEKLLPAQLIAPIGQTVDQALSRREQAGLSHMGMVGTPRRGVQKGQGVV